MEKNDTSAKKILVVDDETDLADILCQYLQSIGYETAYVQDVTSALLKIKSYQPQLIISDIRMPDKSGLDFFKEFSQISGETQSDSPKTPFVLMTGYSDIISVENAFKLGVNELIAKPFDLEAIGLVVDYLLKNDRSKGMGDSKYFSVEIEDFIISKKADYSVFLRVADNYVRVTKAGQDFTQQRIENFARKGVTHIYLNSEDFAKYTDLQFAIAHNIQKRPLDIAVKTKVMNHLIKSLSQNFICNSLDKNTLNRSMNAFEAYTNLAMNNSQVNYILNQIILESPSLADVASMKAIICSAIGNMWKWNSSKAQSRIILAALLCDVGLKDHAGLTKKSRAALNSDEKKIYEQHPYESFELLKQVPGIPDEILYVALQHHENMSGLGFPQKLNKNVTHSYSKLVHGVGMFLETLYLQEESSNIQTALDNINTMQGKFISQQVLKSLYLLFHLKLPANLNGLPLPTETYKVA